MKMNKFKKKLRLGIADYILYLVLFVLISFTLYPVIYTVSVSISDVNAIALGKVKFLPVGFTLDSYKAIFMDNAIIRAYGYTILYSFTATFFFLIFTSMLAYALAIKEFCFRKIFTIFLIITMFISGGLIPFYLTVLSYGLEDTIWALVIPGSVSAWYVIIFRTFFHGLSPSVREAAYIDGANDFIILWRIFVPLSKALFATMILFSVVEEWNRYLYALLFLRDSSKYPLQMILRQMLISFDYEELNRKVEIFKVNEASIKSATILVTIFPIMCIYPFLQKYFVKGIMVGAIKG